MTEIGNRVKKINPISDITSDFTLSSPISEVPTSGSVQYRSRISERVPTYDNLVINGFFILGILFIETFDTGTNFLTEKFSPLLLGIFLKNDLDDFAASKPLKF
jgi:hypothetical protein